MADTPNKDSINSEPQEYQTEEKHQNTSPVLRAELQIPHSVTDAWQTEQKRKNRLERWKFGVEILTLIAIVAYACIAYHQWRTMRNATKATKKSADAAIEAVRVAKDTLKANIDIARQDQRAWVGQAQVLPATLKDADKKPVFLIEGPSATFEVIIINSGKSPALKVKAVTNAYLRPSNVKLLPGYSKGMISVGVLQPQMRYKLVTIIPPLTASIIDSVKNGNKILYIFGKITYEDIFRIPRWTTFCMYLIPSLDNFSACDTYNDAN